MPMGQWTPALFWCVVVCYIVAAWIPVGTAQAGPDSKAACEVTDIDSKGGKTT